MHLHISAIAKAKNMRIGKIPFDARALDSGHVDRPGLKVKTAYGSLEQDRAILPRKQNMLQ